MGTDIHSNFLYQTQIGWCLATPPIQTSQYREQYYEWPINERNYHLFSLITRGYIRSYPQHDTYPNPFSIPKGRTSLEEYISTPMDIYVPDDAGDHTHSWYTYKQLQKCHNIITNVMKSCSYNEHPSTLFDNNYTLATLHNIRQIMKQLQKQHNASDVVWWFSFDS